jgi:hypothetical protein
MEKRIESDVPRGKNAKTSTVNDNPSSTSSRSLYKNDSWSERIRLQVDLYIEACE